MSTIEEPAPLNPEPPEQLRSRAARPGGLHWWPLEVGLEAIAWYRQERMAVIGVDPAFVSPGVTQATMEMYQACSTQMPSDWYEHVERCAMDAAAFVSRYRGEVDAHFDVTAVTQE